MSYNDRQESEKRTQPIRPRAPGSNLYAELLESPARQAVLGFTLVIALFAFEIFNFDTTRFALTNLMGDVSFFGVSWATILAVAFCAIDFAGLAHMFTPERGTNEPREVWYLTGAWLLGASMNAVMTWWAVSLTLLNHTFGNEVLSREILLQYVPVFVAVLVWLTRILFIGAVAVAGERLFERTSHSTGAAQRAPSVPRRPAMPGGAPNRPVPRPMNAAPRTIGDGSGRPAAPMRAVTPPRRR